MRQKRMWKIVLIGTSVGRRAAALAAFAFFFTIALHTAASQEKIDAARQSIDQLEGQRQDADDTLSQLQEDEAYLSGRLRDQNALLAELAEELTEIERQIQEKEQSIAENEALLEEARQREAQQYQDMKLRIRFMYERGSGALLNQLFSAQSFSDFLNFGRYVESIHSYDRKMLQEYREVKEGIARTEEALVAEREALAQEQGRQEEKRQEAQATLAQVKESLADTQGRISDAQDELAQYEEQIRQQKAYEEELERQKAEAEARRLAEEQARREQEQGTPEQGKPEELPPLQIEGSAEEEAMLAAIIECEAGGYSYEGMLAVGSVVLNRVRSPLFPNTIMGVIYQKGQFSPVASGRFATVLARGASSSCYQAARECMAGNITIDCLFFRMDTGRIPGTVIGGNVFY